MLHVLLLRQCHHVVSVLLTCHMDSEIPGNIGIIITNITSPSGLGRGTLRLFVGAHSWRDGHTAAAVFGGAGHHVT